MMVLLVLGATCRSPLDLRVHFPTVLPSRLLLRIPAVMSGQSCQLIRGAFSPFPFIYFPVLWIGIAEDIYPFMNNQTQPNHRLRMHKSCVRYASSLLINQG